jgi:hypothetical protein
VPVKQLVATKIMQMTSIQYVLFQLVMHFVRSLRPMPLLLERTNEQICNMNHDTELAAQKAKIATLEAQLLKLGATVTATTTPVAAPAAVAPLGRSK